MAKVADRYLDCEPWRIVEHGFDSSRSLCSESVFSLANEFMGVRGYPEEGTDAPSLVGSYFGGVYELGEEAEPGGYKGVVRQTHYMVCAADFFRIRLFEGERPLVLDASARNFERTLDLRTGLLSRRYSRPLAMGGTLHVRIERLLGMDNAQAACQRVTLCADRDVAITLELGVDGGVRHRTTGQCSWTAEETAVEEDCAAIRLRTATTAQRVSYAFEVNSPAVCTPVSWERGVALRMTLSLKAGEAVTVERKIRNAVDEPGALSSFTAREMPGFEALLAQNRAHYDAFWALSDVEIDGDALNQQGIRYCVFQLHQTYRGLDPRHNIGAKGLTGEAYNGHAFWDSETYCLPYYLLNDRAAAKNLLLFRYHTLPQAMERARELDCEGACYPIATLNGKEACTLWQHASLQMQPSTAVAYAIMEYAQVTGDTEFLCHEGIEMLVQICRYVVSRGGWNADHTGFGFYGVMGPDEFHMMVHHNFYTNYMGKKTLESTLRVLETMENADAYASREERANWKNIAEHMILLRGDDGLIEQHEGYFGLPHVNIHEIPITDFPLYEHWSYDRIYRTDMIKQPDVLMAMFLYPEDFTAEEKRINYDFYEPRCIHESSLSPSIHAILAQELGMDEAAFNFFGFATRMDMDNYNRNTCEGLHLTSIAAAWVTIVYGFGGLRTSNGKISLSPRLPKAWKRYAFSFRVEDSVVRAEVSGDGCVLSLLSGEAVSLMLDGEWVSVKTAAA